MRLHKELTSIRIWSALGVDDCRGNFESLLRVGDEFTLDDCAILFIAWQFIKSILWQTKAPTTLIIFENPRHRMRKFFVEIQMRLEFFKAQNFINWQRIRNDVQRIILEIHHALAAFDL